MCETETVMSGTSNAPSPVINQPDVALIFEGGGMRNSYTAPVVVELLARNLNFGKVYGISAGSSHTVNYLVRDAARARASFVELVQYPRFGGWGSFLRGTGYFNGPYLYEELIETAPPGDPMRFDWDTFRANPADLHIEAMDWDTGETVAWTKADMTRARDVGLWCAPRPPCPFSCRPPPLPAAPTWTAAWATVGAFC